MGALKRETMMASKQSYNMVGAYLPKDKYKSDIDQSISELFIGKEDDEQLEKEVEKILDGNVPELKLYPEKKEEAPEYKPKKEKIVHHFKIIAQKPIEIKPAEPRQYLKPIRKIIKTGPITKTEYYERHPEKKLENVLDYSAYQKSEPKPFYSRIFDCGKKLYSRFFR